MNKKVLIVEDDHFILNTVSKKFRDSGFEVFVAKDADEAIKSVKSDKPEIVLLDIILPKGNGLELLKTIKSDSESSNIPVIIFSNLGSENDIKTAMDSGAVSYIVKANLTPSSVVEKVKEILSI